MHSKVKKVWKETRNDIFSHHSETSELRLQSVVLKGTVIASVLYELSEAVS